MIVPVVIVAVGSLYLVLWLLRAFGTVVRDRLRAAGSTTPPVGSVVDPEASARSTWTALDDLQLTRLLTSAALGPTDETTRNRTDVSITGDDVHDDA